MRSLLIRVNILLKFTDDFLSGTIQRLSIVLHIKDEPWRQEDGKDYSNKEIKTKGTACQRRCYAGEQRAQH